MPKTRLNMRLVHGEMGECPSQRGILQALSPAGEERSDTGGRTSKPQTASPVTKPKKELGSGLEGPGITRPMRLWTKHLQPEYLCQCSVLPRQESNWITQNHPCSWMNTVPASQDGASPSGPRPWSYSFVIGKKAFYPSQPHLPCHQTLLGSPRKSSSRV